MNRRIILPLILLALAVVAIVAAIVVGNAVAVASDPWHGVPACTDAIADAGGICHGEPR